MGVFAGQPYHCAVHRFGATDRLVAQCHGTRDDGSKPGCTVATPSPDVPYCENCPPHTTVLYDHCKRHPEVVNVTALVEYATEQATAGTIDSVAHLDRTPVYLYRGTKDACYLRGSLQNVQTFFETVGSNVQFNKTTPSAHSWPTADWGTNCGQGVIENCGYDGPGAALQHIYGGSDSNGHGGNLKPPVDAANASLSAFDQAPFMSKDNNGTAAYNESMAHITGLAPYGEVYVPARCKRTGAMCKLHFSFHGCGVVNGPTGDGYYDDQVHHLSFQRWGEANGIVIVYPKLQAHGGTTESQDGCWDGYAQTGEDYSLQSGAQITAIRAMIKAMAGI